MFSVACTALFMKPESQGRDCVHLNVICSTFLMPLCYMSFYLAAHQPPKSLGAYIIVLLGRDVCQKCPEPSDPEDLNRIEAILQT